jgi:hypothetical protein
MSRSLPLSRRSLGTLLLAGAAVAVAAGSVVPAPADGSVNVYTYREPGLIKPLFDEFTSQTGIKVNVIFAKDGLEQRIQAEGENSPADVLLTVDIARLQEAVDDRRHPAGRVRRAGEHHSGGVPRPARPLARRLDARPRRLRLEGARGRRRADLRGPRRSQVARPHLHPLRPAHLQQRAVRRPSRPPRRKGDARLARGPEGEPGQEAVGRRPRRRQGHRGRRLRPRPRQHLLCRADGDRRPRAAGLGGVHEGHHADLRGRRHPHQHFRRRAGRERAQPRQRGHLDGVAGRRRGPAASTPR